jgi:hypothetical protein
MLIQCQRAPLLSGGGSSGGGQSWPGSDILVPSPNSPPSGLCSASDNSKPTYFSDMIPVTDPFQHTRSPFNFHQFLEFLCDFVPFLQFLVSYFSSLKCEYILRVIGTSTAEEGEKPTRKRVRV